jgi:hypothetical protein
VDILSGLYQLRCNLPPEAQDLFKQYEIQMVDTLYRGKLLYNPAELRAEQKKLLSLLDQFAHDYLHTSFSALCGIGQHIVPVITGQSRVPLQQSDPEQTYPDNILLCDEPQITFTLFTPIFPTIYCAYIDQGAKMLSFVRISIDNTHKNARKVHVTIKAFIEGYSDENIKTLEIAANEKKPDISLQLLLSPAKIASIHEITLATLHMQAEIENKLYEEIKLIHLHARTTAFLAIKDAHGRPIELIDYLALWVTPRHPKIRERLSEISDRPDLYYKAGYPQNAESIETQTRAIADLFHYVHKLTYMDNIDPFGIQNEQVLQDVQFPADVLKTAAANCLDGALLFASFLESIALDPLILILPRHAIVGWKLDPETNGWQINPRRKPYQFLDTTLIREKDYTIACQEGQARFEQALSSGWFEKPLFAITGYARLIDIRLCRKKGISPSPLP